MTATAVNVFVIEPTRYCVCGVASRSSSKSADPTAFAQTISPLRTTAAATDGRRSACRSCSRRSSSSGGDMRPKRARHCGERVLDVVVVEIEMGDGAQHPGARAREKHALLAD